MKSTKSFIDSFESFETKDPINMKIKLMRKGTYIVMLLYLERLTEWK